ncbi:(2Fe-2S)-binding protein [Aestuariivivens sediminicola]|uniref:(2Fe-2S)-binding protein n=1 Tax=Aestuariivivens sediminicola TaxID=2913560 RepID=UPI001F56A7F5|nr:(2Fe-2S)-binding protein [Aestuariivivens sediminicola]
MKVSFRINNTVQTIHTDDGETPLLWIIRDVLNLKGTKFGCGRSACGACTIHVDGQAVRSCSFPLVLAEGRTITTIEGMGTPDDPHPVQKAWIDEIVPQCGYCQPGFMMATAALLNNNPIPSDKDIDNSISNICRCATYYRMRKAIHRAAQLQSESNDNK